MIFAEKLVQLRKKAGWSQEELAERVDVPRQAVSKWESAQSMPDLEKIIRLSALFEVSTDYLLKDELEIPEYSGASGSRPAADLESAEETESVTEILCSWVWYVIGTGQSSRSFILVTAC